MKEIKITHATVIPFYNSDDIIRKKLLESGTTIINFNVQTKMNNSPKSKGVMFEKCTIFAKNVEGIEFAEKHIKKDNVLTIIGHEEKSKGNDNKYYTNIIVDEITPISTEPALDDSIGDENLPF